MVLRAGPTNLNNPLSGFPIYSGHDTPREMESHISTFFHKLGFQTVAMDTLPEKVWGVCVKCYKYNNCDETAVLLEL